MKRIIRWGLLIPVLLALLLPLASTRAEGGMQTDGEYYIVNAGDSWYTIQIKFGVRAGTLLDLNDLRARPDLIYVGERIRLPFTVGNTPSVNQPFYYVAQPGDTLQTVVGRTEIDPFAFLLANYMATSLPTTTPLQAGLTYLVPAGPHITTVQPGETLAAVAARFGTTESTLLRFNPGLAGFIYSGQQVFVPIQYDVFTVTPVATPIPGATPVPGATPTPVPVTGAGRLPQVGGSSAGVTQGVQTTGSFYTVRRGDTLALISRKFGVPASALLDLNNLRTRPDVLYAGEQISVGYPVGFTPSWTRAWYYVALPGDTIQTVVQKTEIDQFAFLEANALDFNLPRVTELTAGRAYLIPAGTHRAAVTTTESLAVIATRYQTTVAELLRFNAQLLNGEYVGAPVFIPIQYSTSGAGTGGEVVGGTGGGVSGGTVAGLNGPLEVRDVRINGVAPIPGKPSDSLERRVTLAVVFRGGNGTYTLEEGDIARTLTAPQPEGDDGQWSFVTFTIESVCGGAPQGTIEFASGGVTVVKLYTAGEVLCAP